MWTASQAALSECYALYPESFTANSANNKSNCRFSVYINNKWVDNVGKISNAALNALQQNPKDTVEAGTASRRVSAMVLAVDGKVIALNFGKDGYMVTIVPGQETICEYDGECLNFKG